MRSKNLYLILGLSFIALLFTTSGILYTGGSPGGKTGSPGDVATCTQCHAGSAMAQSGWVTSNIPSSGYTPGTSYNITVTVTQAGINKFGFECTAEDQFGSKVGTLSILMGAQTQLANGNTSVTHKSNGTSGNGTKSWAFAWEAPPTGTGTVTFYAAFNAANGNGGTSGDNIYTSSLEVSEAALNTPPFFVSSPVLEATEGQAYAYAIEAGDGEGTAGLTVTCPTLPIWLSFSDMGGGTASLSGTPMVTHVGIHAVELQVSDGVAAPVSQSFNIIVHPGLDVQTLNFPQGWSLFSTYIAPTDSSAPAVFASIVDSISIVKNGVGLVYWPEFGLNMLGSLIIGQGYQIKTNAPVALDVAGTAVVPEVTQIVLNQGWSLIGYLRQSSASVVTMMSPIVTNVSIVKNGVGSVYWPAFGLNMLGDMQPGQGYQLKLTAASTLVYPAN